MTPEKTSPEPAVHWLRLTSWSLYDFANTLFSAVVITFYFPLYITSVTGANKYLGLATTGAMVLAGFTIPMFGALSDNTGKTKRYLTGATLTCIFFAAMLSVFRVPAALYLCYLLACYFFHACLVFYNSLLVTAAPPHKQGFASGLGVGLGYLGVVMILPLMNQVEARLGTQPVFIFCALSFLIFSIPLFLWVPERPVQKSEKLSWQLLMRENRELIRTCKGLLHKPKLLLFFGGNFFAVDAVNSLIAWFAVYTRNVFDPGKQKLVMVMLILNASAFVWGIISGFLTDRAGSMKTLLGAAGSLVILLAVLTRDLTFEFFCLITFTAGAFAVAGIWTAGRKALLELCPEDHVGEYFGLYGLVTKVSVIASLLYSITSDSLGMKDALWFVFFPAATGFFFLAWSACLKKDPA